MWESRRTEFECENADGSVILTWWKRLVQGINMLGMPPLWVILCGFSRGISWPCGSGTTFIFTCLYRRARGGGGLDFSVMCCCCILITMPDKCWELVFLSIDFYYFQSLMFLKLHSTSFFWNILNFPLHVSSFPPSPLILEEYSFLMALLTLVSLSRSTGAALPSVWHILK